jgi:formylglycine-generating enzyme required for sulfatase activity
MKISFDIFLLGVLIVVFLAACTGSQPTPTTASITASPSPSSSPTTVASATPDVVILTPEPLKSRLDERGIEQVWVPSGTFLMGTSDEDAQVLLGQEYVPDWLALAMERERPQHEVHISAGYWLDRYEVTNAAFQAFVDDSGYQNPDLWSEAGWAWLSAQPAGARPQKAGSDPQSPRMNVTWYEAEAYARWRGGRLPTEAEWEYAARGPQSFVYPWGNQFDSKICNVIKSPGLQPVGSYPRGASWVGAMDMAGNVMEWVQDWYDVEYYKLKVRDDPAGPETGRVKIEKGGWTGAPQLAARSAYAHYEDPPTYSDGHIGFRIITP